MADDGWDISGALTVLEATMDRYLLEQGRELYARGAVEDAVPQASGDSIQVKVLDPRDARVFHVAVLKNPKGRVIARCPCPYRLGEHCRHQLAALLFLKAIAGGEAPAGSPPEAADEGIDAGVEEGSALYRLFDGGDAIATSDDGSLLRVVLHALGSAETPHRLALQLFTGKGWTEVRTADVERWTRRGARGVHARDATLTRLFVEEGSVRAQVDSDVFSLVLATLAGTGRLVTRGGETVSVSREARELCARVVPGRRTALGVELVVRTPAGEEQAFDEVALVPGSVPWIQTERGEFHPLAAGAGGRELEALQEEDLSSIPHEELDRFLTDGLAALERLVEGRLETTEGLLRDVEGVRAARVVLAGNVATLEGALELAYPAGTELEWVPAPSTPEPWAVERDGVVVRYPPAGQSLRRAARELESIGFERDGDRWRIGGAGALARVLERRENAFVRLELPKKLRALDLSDRAPDLHLEVSAGWKGASAGAAFPGAVSPGAEEDREGGEGQGGRSRGFGVDWFEVDVRLTVGDRELSVDPEELGAAARERPGGLFQLDDGTVISLAHESVRSLVDLLESSRGGDAPGRRRVSLAEAAELCEELPGREVAFRREVEELFASLRGRETKEIVARVDARLETILRPYQRAAVDWFGRLGAYGLGGILADEMGLGKTLMALTHLFGRAPASATDSQTSDATRAPVLVVAPTSLIFNWIDESQRFVPDVEVVGLAGKRREEREALIAGEHDLIVTSYALLRLDREALEARSFRAVVLDEGQHIKNPESQTAQAAFALRARERWVLTGTPVENHLLELWSLYHYLLPGFLGAAKEFQRQVVEPVKKGDSEPVERLRRRVRPFLLRRTKDEVLPDLPPRIEQVERVPMSRAQSEVYQRVLAEARRAVESSDEKSSRFQVLAALTRLRQVCCHPRLILDDSEESRKIPSAKFELLLELLDECIEEGHRVLLFSQFTSVLDLVEEALDERSIERCRLDGSTRDRQAVVRRFTEDDQVPVFLISLKAGGFGLNLTQADTVILYDPWWNPAVEEQAAARAHRMGQTLPVHVHRLITAGTVEEKILELQAAKKELADSVIASEEEALGAFGVDDLRGLLYD